MNDGVGVWTWELSDVFIYPMRLMRKQGRFLMDSIDKNSQEAQTSG